MGRPATARTSAVAPAVPAITFPVVTTADPTRFYGRFWVLPAVAEVRAQIGLWDAAGQTRTLVLSDGGSLVEHLDAVESPRLFSYRLTEFAGLFGALVDFAHSEWVFSPHADGTTIDWSYAFTAKRGRRFIVATIVRLAWAPYMRRVLALLVDEVRRVAA